MKEPGQNAKIAHPGVGSFGHLAGVLVAQEIGAKADPGSLSRRRPGAQRPVGGPGRSGLAIAPSSGPVDQGRQAQGLRHHRPKALRRPAGSADHGRSSATRSSISISGTCCSRRPARRAPIIDKLNAALRHALADAKVHEDLCRRRHGFISARRGNAGGRGRAAQERDQALGRCDPRQQYFGAVGDSSKRAQSLAAQSRAGGCCAAGSHLLVRPRLRHQRGVLSALPAPSAPCAFTSVIGRPWVGAMVLTPSRSISWSSRSQ